MLSRILNDSVPIWPSGRWRFQLQLPWPRQGSQAEHRVHPRRRHGLRRCPGVEFAIQDSHAALNRLAKEGMTFTDALASAVCTPTRYAALTSGYCWRSNQARGSTAGAHCWSQIRKRSLVCCVRMAITRALSASGTGLGYQRMRVESLTTLSRLQTARISTGSTINSSSRHRSTFHRTYIKDGTITELPTVETASGRFPGYLRNGPRRPE